jgi:hypothetical protein
VSPPSRRRREGLVGDTTRTEKVRVFEISSKIGRRVSYVLLVVGVLLFLLSTQFLLSEVDTPLHALGLVDVKVLFAPEWSALSALAFCFFGVLNVFCGLLMLAKE